MFANLFRNTALTLGGAALFAASLLAPSASAAPAADGLPDAVDHEIVAAMPPIKLGLADIEVTYVNSWPGSNGIRSFAFHVENHGPATARVSIKRTLYRGSCLDPNAPSCHLGIDVTGQTRELAPGGSYESVVTCSYNKCGVIVEAKPDNMLDPNGSNNTVANWNFYYD